jgi:hypothetical protein
VHDTGCIVLQLRKQNEVLIVGLDDAEKKTQKNCDCFEVLIPHDVYYLANTFFRRIPPLIKGDKPCY